MDTVAFNTSPNLQRATDAKYPSDIDSEESSTRASSFSKPTRGLTSSRTSACMVEYKGSRQKLQ